MSEKMTAKQTICYVCDRLREPSSWRGIVWILTAFGIVITPELAAAIGAAGASIAGLIGVLTDG